jgi:uncharacterized protein YhdP
MMISSPGKIPSLTMKPKRKKLLFWSLLAVFVLGAVTYGAAVHFLDPQLYRHFFQDALTRLLGREVTVGEANVSLWPGVGIAFRDLRIKDRASDFDLLQSKRVILQVKVLPLVIGEIRWKRIVFENPVLKLRRDKDGRFNFLDEPRAETQGKETRRRIVQGLASLFGGTVVFQDGEIAYTDEGLGGSPLTTEIRGFHLELVKVSYRKSFPFRIHGTLAGTPRGADFSIAGTVQNIPEDLNLSQGRIEAEVKMEGVEVSQVWPYLRPWLPLKRLEGALDLNGHYQGTFSEGFKISGQLKLKEAVVDAPQVFSYVLTPHWIHLGFEVTYDLKELQIPRLTLELPEIGVRARGTVYGIGSEDMGLEAEAETSVFDLSDAKRLIPYQIIEPKLSGELFRAEGKGKVQIVSVKLAGKMAEIEHCDDLKNARTLSVQMKLDGAQVKLPWTVPPLDDLRGGLLFKEGHLRMLGIRGGTYHSTLKKVDGVFYRLLHTPTLEVHCEGRLDLSDLRALASTEGSPREYAEIFSPFTQLSGSADYRVFVKGELQGTLQLQNQGTYQLSKVHFAHPKIPFPVTIEEGVLELSNERVRWSGTRAEFGHCSLFMDGSWNWGEKGEPMEMAAKGQVEVRTLLSLLGSPLFPEEVRSKLKPLEGAAGRGELSLKIRRPQGRERVAFEGDFIPRGTTFSPKGVLSSTVLKEGALHVSDLGVGFSRLRVQAGNGLLTLDGTIGKDKVNVSTSGRADLTYLFTLLQSPSLPDSVRAPFKGIQRVKGEADLRLKWMGTTDDWMSALREGEIKFRNVSLQHQKIPVSLSQIEGTLRLDPDQVRLTGLQLKLGESPLAFSGTLSRDPWERKGTGAKRQLTCELYCPDLDLDPLLPPDEGKGPTAYGGLRQWLLDWNAVVKVGVERGRYRGLSFRDLKTELKTMDDRLFLRPFQLKAAGGELRGEGWIEPTEKGIRLEVKPNLSNMEMKAFLRALLGKGSEERVLLTGRVYLDGAEIRGEGVDSRELKESLGGRFKLQCESGVIEKAKTLGRIFSILNVSQLFKGRVPDLRSEGLPYRFITASFQIMDGVLSTEDFLVDSDAMRVTSLGKVDLRRNLIDARVGVHPLGTVDTVLSNVPIAGYILTGKDKAFLSFVYEVKGDLNDPKIEAIPVKALGQSFLGIIKRTLETPFRPFKKDPVPQKQPETKRN